MTDNTYGNLSRFVGGKDGASVPENSGKSFVWSADVRLSSERVSAGALINVRATMGGSNTNRVDTTPQLYIGSDGTLYYGRSAVSGKEIASLSSSEYVNVALQVNVEKITYSVYIEGK